MRHPALLRAARACSCRSAHSGGRAVRPGVPRPPDDAGAGVADPTLVGDGFQAKAAATGRDGRSWWPAIVVSLGAWALVATIIWS